MVVHLPGASEDERQIYAEGNYKTIGWLEHCSRWITSLLQLPKCKYAAPLCIPTNSQLFQNIREIRIQTHLEMCNFGQHAHISNNNAKTRHEVYTSLLTTWCDREQWSIDTIINNQCRSRSVFTIHSVKCNGDQENSGQMRIFAVYLRIRDVGKRCRKCWATREAAKSFLLNVSIYFTHYSE